MILISLFIIPLILFFIKEKLLKKHISKYKSTIDYIIFSTFVNGSTMFLIWFSLYKDTTPIMMARGLIAWLNAPLPYLFEMLKITVPLIVLEKIFISIIIPRITNLTHQGFFVKHIKKSGTFILFAAFFLLIVITISKKENYHVDELYSYGLSNNVGNIHMIFDDGAKYNPTDVFEKYLTANSNHRFDYKNVWINQKNDVHPPLYYMLLHTICSLFPGTFSVWYAGIINIIFSILTLYFLRKLCNSLTSSKTITTMISVGFVFSSGILYTTVFFRMYSMAMCWITAQSYLILQAVDQKECGKRLYAGIFFTTVLGALTHYYCIVFDVLISTAYGIYLLFRKNYKIACEFVSVQVLAGIISYLLFPPMLIHMSLGYRGTEAISNLIVLDDFWPRLKNFFSFINVQIFGGFLGYFLCAILVIIMILHLLEKNGEIMISENTLKTEQKELSTIRYIILIAPILVYFFLVSKMASFQSDRYLYPIYAIAFAAILCLLADISKYIFGQKSLTFIISIALSMTIIGSWQNITWGHLYKGYNKFLEKVSDYSDYDSLCIHGDELNDFMLPILYLEALNYKSITFMENDSLEFLKNLEITDNKNLIVIVIGLSDPERYVKEVLKHCPQYIEYNSLGGYNGSTTYFLHGD